jgi:protein gp37
VSVENQAAADERTPDLLATPAAVRFLSCEPLLGPINDPWKHCRLGYQDLHWLIAGCESGPGARPCDVAWFRSLRDQCAAAGVPFFLKQAGQLPYIEGVGVDPADPITMGHGSRRKPGRVIELPYLDGVQHAELPTVKS